MRAGDLSDQPNPFRLHPQNRRRSNLRPVVSALKLLALVAIGFCVTMFAGTQSRRWLATRLSADFDSLEPAEKKTRLVQMSELGLLGIDPLVSHLDDDQIDIARTAHQLLRQCQAQWAQLSPAESARRHQQLIDSLMAIAVHLPDDRTGWASGLLQETLVSTSDRTDESSRRLFENASDGIATLALSQRPGPSILRSGAIESATPRRVSGRVAPLAVANDSETTEQWTEWSSPENRLPTQSPPAEANSPSGESTAATTLTKPAVVLRSAAAPLKPVGPNEDVVLQSFQQSQESPSAHLEIRPAIDLVDSPMGAFDDRSVMKWLSSPHRALADKAKLELIRRGYDGGQIALAKQITGDDVQTRLELVPVIAASKTIDPVPWLVMLLDDENREVRLRAISVLATMDDPAMTGKLRMKLVDETDPVVTARLKRLLNVR